MSGAYHRDEKAIQEQGVPVITMVDNEIARQNVEKMAQQMGFYAESSEIEGGFRILILIGQQRCLVCCHGDAAKALEQHLPALEPVAFAPQSAMGKTVVVLSSNCMGTGDDALGAALMKGFVYALTQLYTAPDTVLLYNGGAKLSAGGGRHRRRPQGLAGKWCGDFNLWNLSESLWVDRCVGSGLGHQYVYHC